MARMSFSPVAYEIHRLWDDRKMREAWDIIIRHVRDKSPDKEFGRVAAEFIEKNKPDYKTKRDQTPKVKKEKRRPPYGAIKPNTTEIGARFEELDSKLNKTEKYKQLAEDFKCHPNTITARLRDYKKAMAETRED